MSDFFEKITGGIDKGIKAVSSRSKEFLEITRLKGEIKDLEKALELKFNSLGKKVFEMTNNETLNGDDLKMEYEELASLYKKITQTEETIKKVELEALKTRYGSDVSMCLKCGSPNKIGDRFCNSCGTALSSEILSEGIICPRCNNQLQLGTKFCSICGGKVILKEDDIYKNKPSANICYKCEQHLEDTAVFCPSCGVKH